MARKKAKKSPGPDLIRGMKQLRDTIASAPQIQRWDIPCYGDYAIKSPTGKRVVYTDHLQVMLDHPSDAAIENVRDFCNDALAIFNRPRETPDRDVRRLASDILSLLNRIAALEAENERLREEVDELTRKHGNQLKSMENYSNAIERAGFDPCDFSKAVDKMGERIKQLTADAAILAREVDAWRRDSDVGHSPTPIGVSEQVFATEASGALARCRKETK